MKNIPILLLALLMFVFVGFSATTVMAGEDEDAESSIKVKKGDKAPWKLAKVTLAAAVKAALAEVPGTALMAKMEVDDGYLIYEVYIVDKDGKIWEVEVDPGTGKVLEKELEDDDDDDDDENDHHDDDDDDDDDDND